MDLRFAKVLAAVLCLPLLNAACKQGASDAVKSSSSSGGSEWFEDITAKAGLSFRHDPGPAGTYFMPQSIGSGAALLDFDNDGRLDIYLIHNAPTNSQSRNQLFQQGPDGRFIDVSAKSGLDVIGFGMGVAVGDVNNDGLPEVLLTEFGRARLFQNRGHGHFDDISLTAGIDNTRWATSAAFFDYDRDGWLDLVIANYLDYSPTVPCFDTRGALEFCGPQGLQGTVTRLFHNRSATKEGTVRFEDVSVASGLAKRTGAALGVLCADFNGDHWPDVFIADDGMANRLYVNQRNGTFTEEAAQRGIAFNGFGSPAANMGIAFGDVDGDGLSDVFVTHVSWEQHAIWKQGPAGLFQDRTTAAGLGKLARRGTGFGAVLVDFDLDGDLDLTFVNGEIRRGTDPGPFLSGQDTFWHPYAQKNQLLANDGAGAFLEISDGNPSFCGHAAIGRGLACGDIDNDGAVDLLVVNAGAPARLLRNVAPKLGHWLVIRATDPGLGGRDAYGAEVSVRSGGRQWKRLVQPAYSFLVSNDPRVHFGLGSVANVEQIEVVWPDGTTERFAGGPADRHLTLSKGTGTKP